MGWAREVFQSGIGRQARKSLRGWAGSIRSFWKENTPVLGLTLASAQVLHLLGPKTETDLEKKPKVAEHGPGSLGLRWYRVRLQAGEGSG